MRALRLPTGLVTVLLAAVAALPALAQVSVPATSSRPLASNVIVPQARAFVAPAQGAVEITGVDVGVVVLEQVATTTMDIALRNPTSGRLEAELLVPVPVGAAVRGFTFQGSAAEPTAHLLPRDEARRIYDSIVARVRDPAILEFMGLNVIRTSVFPVEAGGVQKVRLTYDHLLEADGDRVDYALPRSESVLYRVPWTVTMKITSKRPISTVYSPSHDIETVRRDERQVSVKLAASARTEPGSFRVSYLLQGGAISASLLAYPDPSNKGGYFLLLAGLPAKPAESRTIKREVTVVIDRSGSMRGEKLEQVREAARQVIEGLDQGEAFNILVYNEAVDFFSKEPVVKSGETIARAREFLGAIRARGGTNIHDALLESVRMKPLAGMLPITLFLTDGLPTIGQTSEVAIRKLALENNTHGRRIFTFGVGVDVNTPLLESVAFASRGTTTFVLPDEDVEVKVAQVFRRLAGPVLSAPEVTFVDDAGASAVHRIGDVFPAKLPDLFEGDQLVLLGRYRGEAPLSVVLGGDYLGAKKTFQFRFELGGATTRNAFVPRLWASRKIGMLVDAIRALGADSDVSSIASSTSPVGRPPRPLVEPRLRELVDEIVRLSTEFGVLTEYTAFLAREGTDLTQIDRVLSEAGDNFRARALVCRTGVASANQDVNRQWQKGQSRLNLGNAYLDEKLERVEITTVQQVSDRAFYKRGDRWIDSRVVTSEEASTPRRVVTFGSEEFRALASRLANEGRQGCVSLKGDIVIVVDGEPILIEGPR